MKMTDEQIKSLVNGYEGLEGWEATEAIDAGKLKEMMDTDPTSIPEDIAEKIRAIYSIDLDTLVNASPNCPLHGWIKEHVPNVTRFSIHTSEYVIDILFNAEDSRGCTIMYPIGEDGERIYLDVIKAKNQSVTSELDIGI